MTYSDRHLARSRSRTLITYAHKDTLPRTFDGGALWWVVAEIDRKLVVEC